MNDKAAMHTIGKASHQTYKTPCDTTFGTPNNVRTVLLENLKKQSKV